MQYVCVYIYTHTLTYTYIINIYHVITYKLAVILMVV